MIEHHKVNEDFEQAYLSVRRKEGRVYTLEQIRTLPKTTASDPNAAEWKMRTTSSRRFCEFVEKTKPKSILDLGCGNGWLLNKLAASSSLLCGMDVNLLELEQADLVMAERPNTRLVYGDIFSVDLEHKFDLIYLSAAVQYFPDLHQLLRRLGDSLSERGSIHFLDSPFYKTDEIVEAKKRSLEYFKGKDAKKMKPFYHHHSWEELNKYQPQILYNPGKTWNKLRRKINSDSPFYWLAINKANLV